MLDLLPEQLDPYMTLLDNVEKTYGSLEGKTVVDFACGPFATLAQKAVSRVGENGSVYAIDPNLVIKEAPNVVLMKSAPDTLVLPKNSIVIAKEPCEGTTAAIDFASSRGIPLYMTLCSCSSTNDNGLLSRYSGMKDIRINVDSPDKVKSIITVPKLKLTEKTFQRAFKRGRIWTLFAEQYLREQFDENTFSIQNGSYYDPIISGERETIYTKKIGTIH